MYACRFLITEAAERHLRTIAEIAQQAANLFKTDLLQMLKDWRWISVSAERNIQAEDMGDIDLTSPFQADGQGFTRFFEYVLNHATNNIRKVIETEFQFPLLAQDKASLDYVYKSFRAEGLEIAFRLDSNWGGYFPSFRELIVQTDLNGKVGNFLAVVDDYNFVREMHRKNLIIPIVGDFGGTKALTSVGDYLRKSGLTVTAYYLSNVEQYLFDGSSFEGFARNIKKLPLTDKSLFIRAVFNMRYSHPAGLSGHLSTTLLQQMTVFVKNFDEGAYRSYGDVIFKH